MGVGNILIQDNRRNPTCPAWQASVDMLWGASGYTEQVAEIGTDGVTLSGILAKIVIDIGTTTNNITFAVSITDSNGATLYSATGLADATIHYKKSPTDFNEAVFIGGLTVAITPSGDAGATGASVSITLGGV